MRRKLPKRAPHDRARRQQPGRGVAGRPLSRRRSVDRRPLQQWHVRLRFGRVGRLRRIRTAESASRNYNAARHRCQRTRAIRHFGVLSLVSDANALAVDERLHRTRCRRAACSRTERVDRTPHRLARCGLVRCSRRARCIRHCARNPNGIRRPRISAPRRTRFISALRSALPPIAAGLLLASGAALAQTNSVHLVAIVIAGTVAILATVFPVNPLWWMLLAAVGGIVFLITQL